VQLFGFANLFSKIFQFGNKSLSLISLGCRGIMIAKPDALLLCC